MRPRSPACARSYQGARTRRAASSPGLWGGTAGSPSRPRAEVTMSGTRRRGAVRRREWRAQGRRHRSTHAPPGRRDRPTCAQAGWGDRRFRPLLFDNRWLVCVTQYVAHVGPQPRELWPVGGWRSRTRRDSRVRSSSAHRATLLAPLGSGAVAQWAARPPVTREVAGSYPVGSAQLTLACRVCVVGTRA